MSKFNYKYGKKFSEVCKHFEIPDKTRNLIYNTALNEGYSELALCYIAVISEEKLLKFLGDNRFAGIYLNELRKYAYKNNDPRWDERRRL